MRRQLSSTRYTTTDQLICAIRALWSFAFVSKTLKGGYMSNRIDRNYRTKQLIGLLSAGGLACSFTMATAQTFPNKPLRFLVPNAPGGGTDLIARGIAQIMSANVGQPIVVVNQSGGG